jgi:DNA helicase II / ATP-dependent DNA helicase PcrA
MTSMREESAMLTDEQRAILAHERGPLRIAAGAGTGKTDMLRRLIVSLVEGGVRPGEILCLTFTVEATKEMRRRVVGALKGRENLDPDELTVQTYHAFAASIVREHALLAGLDGTPALLDQARSWQLVLESLDSCEFDQLEIPWLPSLISRVLTLNEEMERHVVSVEQVHAWSEARPGNDKVSKDRLDGIRAIEAYRDLKRGRNAMDFGDQIELAVELLRSGPNVLDRLAERFRYVFLDEYQDTDVAQRELVKLLGERAELVVAVGDVDQGIFGWRGATIFNMFAFPDDFPGARSLPLSVNFRSGKRILDLANTLVEPFERPDEGREPLKPGPTPPGAIVEAFVSPHQLEEAEEIARRIAEGGGPWSQYAVLTRKRSLFEPIFRALAARGVPVEVDVLGGFWTRPEILDVISWLRVLADPGENIALARLLLGPSIRLSRRDLFFLAAYAKEGNYRRRVGDYDVLPYSLADALVAHEEIPELSDEARARITELRRVWRELAAVAARVSLADLVGEVARVSSLSFELAASPNPEAELSLRHIAKLRDLAQGYQPVAGSLDLAGFVAYLDSIEEADQEEDELRATEENAVRLLTIHRAKGLEWDTVFLPGLAYQVMPSESKGGNNPAECWFRLPFELRGDAEFLPEETKEGIDQLRVDEERRLMYVGITRAKRRLVLSRAWYYGDNKNPKAPSIFWDEAVDTGLVSVTECERPDENPYPGGIGPAEEEKPAFAVVPNPTAIARIEPEVERLRSLEIARPKAAPWRVPSTISVTAFLTFVHDEDEFYWRYVRRVPSPPSPAAKLGVELHRRIEQWSRGAVTAGTSADDIEEPYDLDASERRGDGAYVSPEQMWENFQQSRFAKMTPLMTEQPFTLYLGEGLSVEGRIDAIFEREDGSWEIVDYKTGSSDPDPMQLAIYGTAVERIWSRTPEPMWLTLRNGDVMSAPGLGHFDSTLEDAVRRLRESPSLATPVFRAG